MIKWDDARQAVLIDGSARAIRGIAGRAAPPPNLLHRLVIAVRARRSHG
jgi:hypothetical protein